MTDVYTSRHRDQISATNADQAEFSAMKLGLAVVDAGVMDERISGEMDDLDFGIAGDLDDGAKRWHRDDLAMDGLSGAARDEIVRRGVLLGDNYPFELDGSSLLYRRSKSGFYEYCLSISMAPSITKGRYVRLPRSFERFAAFIIQKHLGTRWKSFHIGAPRNKKNGKQFRDALKLLSAQSSSGVDWVVNPAPGFPDDPGISGDGGMDFVVWSPSSDGRPGQLFVVGQCACGNDWPEKYQDLRMTRLEIWMKPVTIVPLVRCFTTPFLMSEGNFLNAHYEAGWTLDRARLTYMAEEAVSDPDFSRHIPTLRRLQQLGTA